jgi:hypothetical protein
MRHVLPPSVDFQSLRGKEFAMTKQTSLTFVDNPHAPEVFAFRLAGAALFADNLHLTFEAPRVDHSTAPGPVNRVVVGRLIMPVDRVEEMAKFLADYVQSIKAGQPAPAAPDPRTLN